MSRNIKIDGRTLSDVTALKAKSADSDEYFAFDDTHDADAEAADIVAGKTAYVNGEKITGTNTGVAENDLDGLVDGTLTSFVMPNGKTKIKQYLLYNATSLTSANLGAVKTIEQYALYNCKAISGLSLPSTLTSIGNYALYYAAASGTSFEFAPTELCTIGSNGLQYSKISKLTGKFYLNSNAIYSCSSLAEVDGEFTYIGSYAFYGDTALATLKLKINGKIEAYAFYNCYNASAVEFDKDSVVTSLGNYSFSRFAGARTDADSNVIELDFRNSTFTSIPQYCFGGDTSSTNYKNRYMKLLFPEKLSSIAAYAFRYSDNCEFYFVGSTVPTLSATTCWSDATNYKIFVPYSAINAYKTATNWTAQTDYIRGFAEAGAFAEGDTLPTLNAEGYELTWYSDKDCTTEITAAEDGNTEYYCLAGDEKVGFGITSITALECEVTITDENGNTYVAGSGVMKDTVLTITATPATDGYVPYTFTVNGEDFTSGGTITVSADITITAIYYDGENLPVNPTFSENTWTMIREAFRSGIAATIGWAVGDTKTFTSKSGKTYALRISDMTAGRYNLADGTGTTNGVLEFVECYNLNGTTSWAINASPKESYWAGGGFATSDMANTYLPAIFEDLPDGLQAIISEITLSEYSYTSPSPREGTYKLFLPAETEVFASRHYSAEGNTGYDKYTQWGYYAAITTADGNTCTERQKCTVDTTSTRWWLLRSPCSGYYATFCIVSYSGSYSSHDASGTGGVSPCFAI